MSQWIRRTVLACAVGLSAAAGVDAASGQGKPKPDAPVPEAPAAAVPQADLVKADLLADVKSVAPGTAFTVGVRLTVADKWHVYWRNSGETGDATKVTLSGPPGVTFGPVQWPLPRKHDDGTGISYIYEREVLLLVPVTVAKDAKLTGPVTIAADVSWQCCHDTCVDGSAKPTLTLPTAAEAQPDHRELFDAWRQKLPVARDQTPALVGVEQSTVEGKPVLNVRWAEAPKSVEWFPVATRAVAVEDVAVAHDGKATKVTYKVKVYQPDQVLGGTLQSVLVYEDAAGLRHGVTVPFTVPLPEKK
ncbi:MAG TPA: protein-disulfide reductase DsbD domain-containing protein [Humisphaera sp.]